MDDIEELRRIGERAAEPLRRGAFLAIRDVNGLIALIA